MSDNTEKHKLDSSALIENKSSEENFMYIGGNLRNSATYNDLSHLNTETSDKTTNDQDETVDICSDLLGLIPHKIRLYALRSSKENDKFIIQAIFPLV